MITPLKSALLLLPQTISLAFAVCTTTIPQTNYYGISSTSKTTTRDLGPFQPQLNFDFSVSQTGTGKAITAESDIIATFTNVPCPPAGKAPFILEYNFISHSDYGYGGPTTQVDVFNVKGALPRNSAGKGVPTWDNMKTKTGTLVGSWKFPQTEQEQVDKITVLGEVVCAKEINLRFSISNKGNLSGSVGYIEYVGMGSRIRFGCGGP